ncbi:MAG TPA: PAS domain S-box protein [Gemmatimonadaceae bacterium]|nr:PAS domain S-box protein [Gemmatimonadaceae bacterium]
MATAPGDLHRLLIESVDEYAIFALDPDGYILSWNPGAQRFKGYTADEVIGKHFSIFYPRERVEEGFPQYELREAARVGRFEDEGWRVRKDGSLFWANVVITALHDPTGKLVGFAKVTRDLSERRRAEEALRASEERFRLLVQGVKDYAIFMLDPTGHITTWNDGAKRIKGYTADEIIGKHFSIFYPSEDIESRKPERELEIAKSTGVYEEEGWRLRKDGSRFWASVVITALRNESGELAGFAKVTRDLTERKAAHERELEAARAAAEKEGARQIAEVVRKRAETLQNLTAAMSAAHTPEAIARVIVDQGIPALGAAAGAVGILDESEQTVTLIGDGGYPNLPASGRSMRVDSHIPMGKALHTRQPVICRTREERDREFPAVSAILAPFSASVVLPLADQGRMVGAVALHFDDHTPLTEDTIQFAEAFTQQAAQALERASLYQAERTARARADEANRAKSQFLAAMSHELRTPLNAIAGYADLIAMGVRGPVTREQQEDLQRIKRSQQHLLGIINDILNFSRVEAGQMHFDFAAVPVTDVMEAARQMIAPQAAAKSIDFVVVECPAGAVVWADRAKTEQVLLNLLSNAVKFTAKGSVTLRCELRGPKQIALSVRDTGIGIPEAELEHVFEPFVQVGRGFTQPNEGTGLGLAISRDLARGMGGDITATSKVGEGSTFTLVLPRPTEENARAAA